MTPRERVLKALSLEAPDRAPRDFPGFTPMSRDTFIKNAGDIDPCEYFKIDCRGVGFAPTKYEVDYTRFYAGRGYNPKKFTYDDFGVGHLQSEQTNWHYTHFISPLQDSSDLNDFIDYPLPDLDAPYRSEHLPGETAAIHARGFAVYGHLQMTLFERAWQIRGFENFMMDMHENPDIVDCLLDRLFMIRLEGAKSFARAGVDIIKMGDDVAMQTGMIISPGLWRQYFKPRMAKIIEEARRIKPGIHIFYHSDGKPEKIYDELIEIGVTILNPIQPECVDPAEVKNKYGDRAAFWGAIGIQHTLPFGSVEDVRNEVRLRMRTIGKNGGYVVAPTHVIAPEVPWENLKALYDAVDEFGGY